jgi:hypothetical protein
VLLLLGVAAECPEAACCEGLLLPAAEPATGGGETGAAACALGRTTSPPSAAVLRHLLLRCVRRTSWRGSLTRPAGLAWLVALLGCCLTA